MLPYSNVSLSKLTKDSHGGKKGMKRWKKNLLVLALLSFAVIFANVTPKYHTVSAASKTTLNYKKKTLSKGQTLKLKVKGTKKKVKWSSSKKKVVSVTLASGKTIKAEDLIADAEAQFGKDVRQYCPDVKHIVVIFNPADITGLITLLYSGLKPSQVSTLAALDSTRLQNELVKFFHIPASDIQNCRTYGGHGEQMAVFASTTKIKGEPLTDFIGTTRLPLADWEALKVRVIQGGKHIIDLRGRSSFQSPAYLSIEMIAAAMGGQPFRWPAGTYVSNSKFDHIMMAMETSITKDGVTYKEVAGTPAEQEELEKSYEHLCKLRDEVIEMGIIPAIKDWHALNPNID